MKKKRIQGLCLLLIGFVLLSGRAAAVMRNTVFLEETGSGAVVLVRLEERQDEILSVGLNLQISFSEGDATQAEVRFAFDSAVQSKVMEYRYNAANGILYLYLSGQQGLFTDKELKLGEVTVSAPEGSTLTAQIAVVEDSLQLINAAYDDESNGNVSAPEAPEFTINGEQPGDDEVIMPPETDGGNDSQDPGNTGVPDNPANSQNPGGSDHSGGDAPASGSNQPANPAGTTPSQSGTGSTAPTAATTAAERPTEKETAESMGNKEEDENLENTDESGQTSASQSQESSSADRQAGPAPDQNKSQDGIGHLLLLGGLGIAGVAGLIVFCVWLDQYSRVRRRRMRRAKARSSRPAERRVHHVALSERDAAARHAAAERAKENLKHRPQKEKDTGRP